MERKRMTPADKKRLIITSTILLLFIIGFITLVVIYWDYIWGLCTKDEEITKQIQQFLNKYNSWAWLILILFMILQVVFAILPNGPFEMLAGLMYGPYLGITIALIGTTLGTLIVILLVKAFGKGFAALFVNIDDGDKYSLLKDRKRCLVIMFGLLIVPALPKDFLAFLVPFTKVKTYEYLILNLIARAPVTIFSVIVGDSLMSGNFTLAIILGVIAATIGLICIIFNKKIVQILTKTKEVNE